MFIRNSGEIIGRADDAIIVWVVVGQPGSFIHNSGLIWGVGNAIDMTGNLRVENTDTGALVGDVVGFSGEQTLINAGRIDGFGI